MRSLIDDLYAELGERARRISELESELLFKESLMSIIRGQLQGEGMLIGNTEALKKYGIDITESEEEPLPFSGEQYEEENKVELPTMPIDVASMLINATVEYQTPSICKVFGAGDTSFADKYSKNDLKEIAEHLLVYCNNSDESEDDTQS